MYENQRDGGITFQKSGFIDIHSHILPGVDDGPDTLDQSLKAVRRYEDLGFCSVIATPHWIPATRWTKSPAEIVDKVKEVNLKLRERNIALTILPGMEIAVSEHLHDLVTSAQCLSLGSRNFFLIEFPLTPLMNSFSEYCISQLEADKTLKFIIAHPERCPVFLSNETILHKLVRNGMMVQMNVTSILGGYGKKIQETSFKYLRSGLVHFLATDSHARKNRMPPSKKEWKRLQKLIGEKAIAAAFETNPRKMLAGKMVAPLKIDISNTDLSYRAAWETGVFNSFRKLFSKV